MSKEILVPDIGDFEKVEIIEVLVKPGDSIKKDESLITLEMLRRRSERLRGITPS